MILEYLCQYYIICTTCNYNYDPNIKISIHHAYLKAIHIGDKSMVFTIHVVTNTFYQWILLICLLWCIHLVNITRLMGVNQTISSFQLSNKRLQKSTDIAYETIYIETIYIENLRLLSGEYISKVSSLVIRFVSQLQYFHAF